VSAACRVFGGDAVGNLLGEAGDDLAPVAE
jgi:hypothetical protein